MNERVLFVDDDAALLGMLKRNFSLEFDVKTAENGAEALKLIENSQPFAAVMVDMRMPGMDGVELIKHARDLAPDSVYVMLTGNQDLTTAIQAVNDGHVFRFLNKPCEVETIRSAIKAALLQHDLVVSQKELLNSTFTGAIGVLTEIIESMDTPLVDSSRVKDMSCELAKSHGIPTSWSMSLACRLMFVGVPLLPSSQREFLLNDDINTDGHKEAVERLLEISMQLIAKIPRLGPVADVLSAALKADGQICKHDPNSIQFANLMLISFYAQLLLERGDSRKSILAEVIRRFDGLDTIVTNTLHDELVPPDDKLEEVLSNVSEDSQLRRLAPHELEEGMVVAEHVRMESGALLVTAGRELTAVIIQRLRALAIEHPLEVKIMGSPAPEAIPN
ncbi:MAG TPA: response regulator [Planctomycetaceae bacterium]|nr:response regulator [Planctomycetaceae bacterium]